MFRDFNKFEDSPCSYFSSSVQLIETPIEHIIIPLRPYQTSSSSLKSQNVLVLSHLFQRERIYIRCPALIFATSYMLLCYIIVLIFRLKKTNKIWRLHFVMQLTRFLYCQSHLLILLLSTMMRPSEFFASMKNNVSHTVLQIQRRVYVKICRDVFMGWAINTYLVCSSVSCSYASHQVLLLCVTKWTNTWEVLPCK